MPKNLFFVKTYVLRSPGANNATSTYIGVVLHTFTAASLHKLST